MKIHRVVQMLGATTSTGKLADDMYALGHKDYYSEAEDRYIPISHMDFQHMVRAFVKQNDEDVRTDTQEGKVVPLVQENLSLSRQRDSWKEKAMNMMEKSSYDDLKKQTDVLVKDNSELRFQIQQVDRNETVSKEAYDVAWDSNKYWQKKYDELNVKYVHDCVWKERYEHELKMAEYWKDAFYKKDVIKGCGYTFSEIPNDTDGQEFVDTMKQYFNKKSYKMRVRGQHVKPELRGTGVTSHGQSIDESTHMRIYIDIK